MSWPRQSLIDLLGVEHPIMQAPMAGAMRPPASRTPYDLEHLMSPEQKALVRETWSRVAPTADRAARLFYERLFEIDATTRSLFKTTNLAEQRGKLIQAVTLVVQGLDHLEALVPAFADMGRRHAQKGVTDRHYDTVGAALLWMLEQRLGSWWTPEAKAAWSGAYAQLAGVMRGCVGGPGAR